MELSDKETELVWDWFKVVQARNANYLASDDYELAEKIYEAVGVPVPDSITVNCR